MTTMLAAALAYASRGVRVFPCYWPVRGRKCSCSDPDCGSPGKHPRTEHGFLDASTDEDRIRAWWTAAPHAVIATPTGTTYGFDVLDVDPRNGGEDSLQALRELGEIPMTLVTETGGGGSHTWFRAAHKGLSMGPFLPGLDWKTTGGYVILPPSRHVSGGVYRWEDGHELGTVELPPVPPWLIEYIRECQGARLPAANGNGDLPLRGDEPVTEGSRHKWICSRAGQLRNAGLRGDVLLAALLELSRTRCSPPLPEDEVARIAEDASSKWDEARRARVGSTTAPEEAPALRILIEPYEGFHARVSSLPPIRPLIGELVTEDASVMVHGQPREGKTWTLLELTAAAVTGTPAFGLERFSVAEPIPTLFVHEEDPERRIHERFELLWSGRGVRPLPGTLFVSVRRGLFLDDEDTQAYLIEAAIRYGVRLTLLDPLRALSSCVDQGPRELQPLAEFFRRFAGETGSALAVAHHDVKPDKKQVDERKLPQRASGGGIFSVMDSPIHVERFGADSSVCFPSGFKHGNQDPAPFLFRMAAEGESLRLIGEDMSGESASEMSLRVQITDWLKQHPDTSTNAIAKAVSRSKDRTTAILERLEDDDLVLSRPGPNRSVLWSLTE